MNIPIVSRTPRKLSIAERRVREILAAPHSGEWTLDLLHWQVNYELDVEDMVSKSTVRSAIKSLPAGCVSRKGQRLIIAARHFAPTTEVVTTLTVMELRDYDIPVLIERHIEAIRQALLLADDSALYHTLEWASHGNYGIEYTIYGRMLVWGHTS